MYSTTRDRALAAAAATEHVATYGAPMPVTARKIARALIVAALVVVGLIVAANLIGSAWDVEYCQSVVDSFTGPTDHPEAVRCTALLNG